MSEAGSGERAAVFFLRDEKTDLERKIGRLQRAVRDCEDCLESEGLRAMLRAAQVERDLIAELLADQCGEDALSLEAAIMGHIQRMQRERKRQARSWRRGERTSGGYWDAEIKQAALQNILRRYHAWAHGETLHERRSATLEGRGERDDGAYPWYSQSGAARDGADADQGAGRGDYRSRSAEMPYKDIGAALEPLPIPGEHLEIIAEPLGQVIVMGYVHDEELKQRIIETLLDVDGVYEVIEHIQVVARGDCPACNDTARPPSADAARRNGSHYR